MEYYNKDYKEVIKYLKTSNLGLSSKEAKVLLDKYGENKIVEEKRKSKLKIFLDQFKDMMIIILLIVAFLLLGMGIFITHEYTDSIVILVVVLINAIMGFIQEAKAEVTLKDLKDYSVLMCKVKREGSIRVIEASKLVPGDIILLESGDKVVADARIIKETSLKVDESALTGESVPVTKNSKKLKGELSIQDQNNMLFMGSSITNGNVLAVVVRTGMLTELGKIAVSLNTPYSVPTPLELKINEISKKLTYLIIFIIIVIFIYSMFRHYQVLDTIMLCVSLAVAAIPEGLPAVITISLSNGASSMAKKKAIVKTMSSIETLGCTDVICSDKTGTITENKMTVKDIYTSNEAMLKYIASLCNEVIVTDTLMGDPTETSVIEYYYKDKKQYLDIINLYPKITSIPFDSDRKMMSSINKIDNNIYVLTKGSLDSILDVCSYIDDGRIKKLTKEKINNIRMMEKQFASKALRVMAYAYKKLDQVPKKRDLDNIESDLVFVGLIGIIDPPRKSVKNSVLLAKSAGIKTIMITGDSLDTATEIAKNVGIIKDSKEATLGSMLDSLTDQKLDKVIENYGVFARVSPTHKRRIVASLQRLNKVVAMTGDGVNDAPAIKDAHVGIGMGITGTEVTKSVADIILLDDSYSTIVEATKEGRKIYSNIRNNVVYSLSSNFAEIFVTLIGMFTGNVILIPIHILFIDLVTDSIPSICISFEDAEKDIMNKPPRGKDKPLFTSFIYAHIISSSIIETVFVLVTYFISLKCLGPTKATTIALISMIMQEIIYSVSCRNLNKPIKEHGFFGNKVFNLGLAILILIECIVLFTPIGQFLSIEIVPFKWFIGVILFNLVSFVLYEYAKKLIKRDYKD